MEKFIKLKGVTKCPPVGSKELSDVEKERISRMANDFSSWRKKKKAKNND